MNRGSLPRVPFRALAGALHPTPQRRSSRRSSRRPPSAALLALAAFAALLLGACAPGTDVESNVQPTVISVCAPPTCSDTLVIQGRNFGDGAGGENSYVVAGADVSGRGGVRVATTSWGPSRIEAEVPETAGYGYLFVVVRGVRSSGIPVNLP